ncbi:MAG: nuclear transport factor 2 family protein, partial [Gammaproteobacteria bacterium]
MNTLAELAARLDRLESRNAITELATRYAIACDEQDLDALVALFT